MNVDQNFEEYKEQLNEKNSCSGMPHSIRDMKNVEIMRDREKSQNVGKNNLYNCRKCGNTIITVDKDAGITPMFIPCDVCKGKMSSMMYNVPEVLVPSHQWIDDNSGCLSLKAIPIRDKEVPLFENLKVAHNIIEDQIDYGCRLNIGNSQGVSGQTAYHKKFNKGKKRGK